MAKKINKKQSAKKKKKEEVKKGKIHGDPCIEIM